MKKILLFLSLLLLHLFFYNTSLFAEDTIESIENLQIKYEKNIHVSNTLKIDITPLISGYQEYLGYEDLVFEWDITGASTVVGPILERKFSASGIKKISLNIFTDINSERTLVGNIGLEIFVYEKSIPFVFSKKLEENRKQDFKDIGKTSQVYIYEVADFSEGNIYNKDITSSLEKYWSKEKGKSDYIGVWGEKEFLFSVISKLNQEQENQDSNKNLNLALFSGFNGNILEGYLGNLLTDKDYIEDSIIVNDTFIFETIKSPERMENLKSELSEKGFDYIDIDLVTGIHKYFFLSRFINTLSNTGVSTTDIYILLMIPVLLTLISFTKHFIGITPIGIILPLFLAILLYKIGVIFTITILVILFITNLGISKVINKYNLLYTPKVSFIAIANIIALFLALDYLIRYNIISLQLHDTLYIILFIIIAEKMITVIISKEFREYKRNLIGTIFVGLLGFIVLSINFQQVFILAYPEIIIALAPINFLIGRFTGLRITEYLRFKEVIKNIEEE